MGLLDEAIREHLELLRRRGATAEEIQRRERDALAPVVARGDEESGAPQPGSPEAQAEEPASSPAAGEEAADTGATSPAQLAEDEVNGQTRGTDSQESPLEHPVMPEPAGHEPSPEPYGESDTAPEPASHDEPVRASSPFVSNELWLDDDVGDRNPEPVGAESPAAEDDVLEDTPEFLQETPEHDRLWFEQRPPRRFDFEQ